MPLLPLQWLAGDAALATALPTARVLINLLPLTPQTRGLINASLLARLPLGAGLVNLARGAHVVDDDLLGALDAGRLSHAVLDVFHQEPLPAAHRFWRHPQVTVLPHAAAATDLRTAAAIAARNIDALARGAPLMNLVARTAGY
jgi:glyoxylate/hydroxypyruvate reductase A